MLQRRLIGLALFVVFATLGVRSASASALTSLSELERSVAAEALESVGWSIEPAPEGKRIEAIKIATLEVFDDRDPVPNFLNIFHTTTRPHVIRRELLFEAGSLYSQARVEESARKLRAVRQLSLVLIVPAQGSAPDRVRVLVIAKDVWSLRLNSDFEADENGLSYLLLNPSEENLAGLHTSIGALFVLQPDNYSLGLIGSHPRILGTRLTGAVSAHLLFNRETGKAEGSYGGVVYGQPVYSLQTRWAWMTTVTWLTEVTRWIRGGQVATFDARATPETGEAIPIAYDTNELSGGYELTRTFGRRIKTKVSVGVEAELSRYRTPAVAGVSAEAMTEFEQTLVPLSDRRWGPYFQLQSYTGEFLSNHNLETLGLQEDFRLGHDLLLRIYPASKELGSTRDLIGTLVGLGYTFALGDGLVRLSASSRVEFRPDREHDATIELGARIMSPSLGFGRLVYDGRIINRYQDFLNRAPYALGGNGRLRGYPRNWLIGKDLAVQNLEFRSSSINILSAELGLAAFYDAGDARDHFDELSLRHGVGAGIRIMFPQANRSVFRADWAFPIFDDEFSTFPGRPIVTFEQAFDPPGIGSTSIADTGR